MPVTDAQRKSSGFLGPVPPEIVNASKGISDKYKALSADAARVARMRRGPDKTVAAKKIESRYYELLEAARKEANA